MVERAWGEVEFDLFGCRAAGPAARGRWFGHRGLLGGVFDDGNAGVLEGRHDDLPENAFYMVGSIDDAVEKGRAMVSEAEDQ